MTSKTTKDNSKKKRILIVDDESDVDIVLKRVFGQSGFNVDSYDDPILALENFKAGLYGLILLDIKMPEMDGFNLYQKMKKIDTKIKVCFLTASVIKHTGDNLNIMALALSTVVSIQNAYARMAVGILPGGAMQVFMIGSDGTVNTRWKQSGDPGAQWNAWQQFGQLKGKDITAGKLPGGAIQVFMTGTDGTLYTRWKESADPGAQWTQWTAFA